MIHKLALAHFFSVFFDGSSRCRWLISAQILELVDVTIVSPSTLGLSWLWPRYGQEVGSVAGSEFFDLPNLCSLDPA